MKQFHICLLFTAWLLASDFVLHAADSPSQTPEAGSLVEREKDLDWSFTPDPALPNVLILGDSISIGYTLQVRKLLAGRANVFRPISADGRSAVNCVGTTDALKHIDHWLAGHKWAVIYFNWGQHDLKHVAVGSGENSNNPADPVQATVEQYSRNLDVIVGKLKATGARLVFATTTPVTPGTTNPLRDPDAPARYNAAALKIMEANGIREDDLYAICNSQLDKLQFPHNVHFTSYGYAVLAREVASVINEELPAAATGKAGLSRSGN